MPDSEDQRQARLGHERRGRSVAASRDPQAEGIARRFEIALVVGALLVVPIIVLEEARVGQPWDGIAVVLDWIVWVAFLSEVVVMLAVVRDRRAWLASHPLEIAIVVLTPPFVTAGLRAARVFRLLRLVRLLRLAQLGRRVFSLRGLQFAAIVALVTVFAGGTAFGDIEHRSTWDGIYWCVTTMTTLGSDIQPATTGGRVLALLVVVVGISFVALLTGAIARRFLEPEIVEIDEEVEDAEADLLNQVREVAERLRLIEDALTRQRSSGGSG